MSGLDFSDVRKQLGKPLEAACRQQPWSNRAIQPPIMVPTDGDTLYRNSFKKQRRPMAVLASNIWPFSGSYSSGLLQERFQKLLGFFETVFCPRVTPELACFTICEPVGIGGNAQSPC